MLKLQYFDHLMQRADSLEDLDAGKYWRQEKGITEDKMVGWHHGLNGLEFEQAPGDSEGQGRPWGRKESDRLSNWTPTWAPAATSGKKGCSPKLLTRLLLALFMAPQASQVPSKGKGCALPGCWSVKSTVFMEALSKPVDSRTWSGYYQSRQRAQSLKTPRTAHHNWAQLKASPHFLAHFVQHLSPNCSHRCFYHLRLKMALSGQQSTQCVCTQSCPTLCSLMDFTPPGSSVHRISQARILEWVAICSSKGSSWPRDQTSVSCLAGGFISTGATWEANGLLEGPDIEKLTQSGD